MAHISVTTDAENFDNWYRREYRRVLAAVVVGHRCPLEVAEDATADAFVTALEAWPKVSGMDYPERWVVRVAINRARRLSWRIGREDELLRSRRDRQPEMALPDQDVRRQISALPPRQRRAIVLRYFADLPQNEIAQDLGVANGTAAATLHQARENLAANLRTPDQSSENQST